LRDGRTTVEVRGRFFSTTTPVTVGIADAEFVEVLGLPDHVLISKAPSW